jgi:hypothetical protein
MRGIYVAPRTNGLHVVCGECLGMMVPEQGTTFAEPEDDPEVGEWLWYRCILNPRHITRALPLPVQMARS